MKTELTNQEKLIKAQDELIFLLDKQSLNMKFTSEDCDAWAKLKLEVLRLKKEVEFDLLCDPDIYEARINEHFEANMDKIIGPNEK